MVYEYTRPRAPIAAQYKSPGPCYSLPGLVGQTKHDPRSEKKKDPAWQFGERHASLFSDCSPGPVHYPDMRITNQGKDGTPHYSLYGRHKDVRPFNVPAPGTYSPEKAGQSSYPSSPKYSFGDRTKLRSTDKNPAPNSYSLPTLIGKTVEGNKSQAPSFSQVGRSKVGGFSEDLQRTPGPGAYKVTSPNTYKLHKPEYSMLGRNMMPGDSTQKPGPGAHSPEKVYITKPTPQSSSFGIRHSEYTCPVIDHLMA